MSVDGWTTKKLGDLVWTDYESLKEDTNPDFSFYYIDISSVSEGSIHFPSNKITFRESPSRARKIVRRGDVLMSTVRPNLKAFARFDHSDDDFIASTGFAVLRPKNGVDSAFILYSILSDSVSKQIESLVVGSNYPAINSTDVNNLEVIVPPFAEQTQIAAILSTVDRAIEQTEAIIAKQQRIKTGLMQDLLTRGIDAQGNIRTEATHEFKDSPLGRIPVEWEVEEIDKLLDAIIDYRGKTPIKSEAGIPLITAKTVRFGYLEAPDEFIPEEEYTKRMTRGYSSKGDVLFTTEAPLGNVAQIEDERVALGQRLITLKSGPRLKSDFLFYILMDEGIRRQFDALSSGSTVTGIKQSQFRKVFIRVPNTLEEQEKITSTLKSIDSELHITKGDLEKLQSLKTGLMQDLLTGRVRVGGMAGPWTE